LGKKWFAFSKLEVKSVEGIMNEIKGMMWNQIKMSELGLVGFKDDKLEYQ
jgi:hypothetical protein